MTNPFHALIIEDDEDIAKLVALQVTALQGMSTHTPFLKEATKLQQHEVFDIIILDLSLPDGDGLEFCKQIRKLNESTPILMLTARSNEVNRVLGLELGADDYLSKPFSLAELKARIKALLRRSRTTALNVVANSEIRVGTLFLDPQKHECRIDNQVITLTAKEFELLKLFACNPNQVFSRLELLDKVWGMHHDGYEHTVNSHLNRLRKKIEIDPTKPKLLETIWGVGYKLNTDAIEKSSHEH